VGRQSEHEARYHEDSLAAPHTERRVGAMAIVTRNAAPPDLPSADDSIRKHFEHAGEPEP
jgi:hypothetical protein